jgi:hypothetical protein
LVIVAGASASTGNGNFYWRFNTDTGLNYNTFGPAFNAASSYVGSSIFAAIGQENTDSITFGLQSTAVGGVVRAALRLDGGNSSGVKTFTSVGAGSASGGTDQGQYIVQGFWGNSSTISSISIVSDYTMDAGKVYVYASA